VNAAIGRALLDGKAAEDDRLFAFCQSFDRWNFLHSAIDARISGVYRPCPHPFVALDRQQPTHEPFHYQNQQSAH
jgi:hypothetical protein